MFLLLFLISVGGFLLSNGSFAISTKDDSLYAIEGGLSKVSDDEDS